MSDSNHSNKQLIRSLITVAILIFLGLIYWTYNDDHPAPGALPHISLESVSGRSVNFATLKGKPLVINLWATWCPPCRKELPMLMQASRQYPGINFYFPEQGNNFRNVKKYSDAHQLDDNVVLLDENTHLSKFFGVIGYPTTIFYNAEGHIVTIHRGALTPQLLHEYLTRIGNHQSHS